MPALSSVYVADQEETEDGINEIPTSVINALFKEHNFDEDLKMHIWDFAGQDLYYTTHQVGTIILEQTKNSKSASKPYNFPVFYF